MAGNEASLFDLRSGPSSNQDSRLQLLVRLRSLKPELKTEYTAPLLSPGNRLNVSRNSQPISEWQRFLCVFIGGTLLQRQ